MVRKKLLIAQQLGPAELVPIEKLFLDHDNPRLADQHFSVGQQDEIIQALWQDRAVNEVLDSIAANGYWGHEILFAIVEDGNRVVIEGNRRLAAVKILVDSGLRRRLKISGIPQLAAERLNALKSLPVIQCTRQNVWQYIGFKHINGPQEWDSIAKAQYIATVHNDYKIPLKDIAQNIGDRHSTVNRLYCGLMVLNQAEKSGQFDRNNRWNTRFAYSHLWTGLGYEGIREFLGINDSADMSQNPVPKSKLSRLGELCIWLYGSKKGSQPPVIRSQNPDLRNLDEVLRTKNGLAALRTGLPLEISLRASQGDERLFREAVILLDQKLKEAVGLVSTGFKNAPDLYPKIENIQTLAETLLNQARSLKLPVGKTSPSGGTAQ